MTTIAEIISTASHYGNSSIYRSQDGVGYYAYVPYYDDQPRGPSTEIRDIDRTRLMQRIRGIKVGIALAAAAEEFDLGGDEWRDDVEHLRYRTTECNPQDHRYGVSDWRKEVRALIRKHRAIN